MRRKKIRNKGIAIIWVILVVSSSITFARPYLGEQIVEGDIKENMVNNVNTFPTPLNYTAELSSAISSIETSGDHVLGFDTIDASGNAITASPDYTPHPGRMGWVSIDTDGDATYSSQFYDGRLLFGSRSLLKDGTAYMVGTNDTFFNLSPPSNIYVYVYNFADDSLTEVFSYDDPEYVNVRMTHGIDLFEDYVLVSGRVFNSTGSGSADERRGAVYLFNYTGQLQWRIVFDDIPEESYSDCFAIRHKDFILVAASYYNVTTSATNTRLYKIDMSGTSELVMDSALVFGGEVDIVSFGIRDMEGVESSIGLVKLGTPEVYILDPIESTLNSFAVGNDITGTTSGQVTAARRGPYYGFHYKSDLDVYFTNFAGVDEKVFVSSRESLSGTVGLTESYLFVGFHKQYGRGHVLTYPVALPNMIYDVHDLQAMRDDLSGDYLLANDIDASETSGWNGGAGFEPIGDNIDRFTGSLDGRGHIVKGLFINRSNTNYIGGLFGYIGSSGKVENITLEDLHVSGNNYVGGIAGMNDGEINNTSVTGTVYGGDHVGGLVGYNQRNGPGLILNSHSSGHVTGIDNVGGLVGWNNGGTSNVAKIWNSSANVIVFGRMYVGGFIGRNIGRINNCFSKGDVSGEDRVGGFLGRNDYWVAGGHGHIYNSYATGSVTRSAGTSERIAGFASDNTRGKIINSYSTGSVHFADSEDPTNRGFIASLSTAGDYEMNGNFWDIETSGQTSTACNATGKITEDLMNITTFTDAGWDIIAVTEYPNTDYKWNIVDTVTHPFLSNNILANGPEFTEVYTWEDLHNIRFDLTGSYRLMNDLGPSDVGYEVYNAGDGWLPIGNITKRFTGSFDGQNHTINGLYIDCTNTDYIGIFGLVGGDGEVRNVGLLDADVSGKRFVGGLVGTNYGTVKNSYATGTVSGDEFVGGLVGMNWEGTVSNSYASGDVSGYRYVGGLVGYSQGMMKNSYAMDSSINGDYYIGGLAGWKSGTISNSHYNIDSVSINGGHYITIGGIFNEQYEDWFNNNMSLDISDYSDTLAPIDDNYEIRTVDGLRDLLGFTDREGYKFRLAAELDLSSEPDFYIPYFAGLIDGNGHSIYNLKLDLPFAPYLGLFGYLSGGEVHNVFVQDTVVKGNYHVGGLVGCNWYGKVSNSSVTGFVSGNNHVGVLVGFNRGTVENTYATGDMRGDRRVGGLIGWNRGTVENSYAKVDVTRNEGSTNTDFGGFVGENYQSKIINSYSTGRVQYEDAVDPTDKGFAGSVDTGGVYEMNGNFWDTETSGQTSTAGNATGKTTSKMMNITTFTDAGWDFDNIWVMVDGETYPQHIWLQTDHPVADAGQDQIVDEGTSVTFDGSGSYDDLGISNYTWSFNDGINDITLYGISPSHRFSEPGIFEVKLNVTNPVGLWDTDVINITINDIMPKNLQVYAGDRLVILNWSSPANDTNVVNYNIYRGNTSGELSLYDQVGRDETEYIDENVVNGRNYFYRVSSITDVTESRKTEEFSVFPSTTPTTPQNLSISTGETYLVLNWDEPADDGGLPILEYRIYRQVSGEFETYIIHVDGNATKYNDTGLSKGVTYYYNVTAVNKNGESEPTSCNHATPSSWLADSPWPCFGGNARKSGLSPQDSSHIDGTLLWSFHTNGTINTSPAIAEDGTIYFGSHDHRFYALYPDGTLKWSFVAGSDISLSSPAIAADGTIYFGCRDRRLYALNPDGTLKWTHETAWDIQSSPSIGQDGTIYISSDRYLSAVNPDGSRRWRLDIGNRGTWKSYSSPSIGPDGTVYIGSSDNRIYAIDPDGQIKWSFSTGATVYSSPSIGDDGTIYFGSNDNRVYALYPNGNLKWSYLTGGSVYSSPALGIDGTVYVGSDNNRVYAINSDGTLKWSFNTGDNVRSSPAVCADGIIYIGSSNNRLYALNPNGTVKWNYRTGGDVRSSPSIGIDGTIYVGSNDNHMYAFGSSQPPSAPRNFTTKIVAEGIELTWDAPMDDGGAEITNYNIYRGNASGELTLLTTVGNVYNYTDDVYVDKGITYYYRVSAVNSAGEGELSDEIIISHLFIPSSPQNFQATLIDGYVLLEWDAPLDDGGLEITGYRIYRGVDSGDLSYLESVEGTALTYMDVHVEYDMTYHYQVSAENEVGEGPLSNEVEVTTLRYYTITVGPVKDHNDQPLVGATVTISWNPELVDTTDGQGMAYFSVDFDPSETEFTYTIEHEDLDETVTGRFVGDNSGKILPDGSKGYYIPKNLTIMVPILLVILLTTIIFLMAGKVLFNRSKSSIGFVGTSQTGKSVFLIFLYLSLIESGYRINMSDESIIKDGLRRLRTGIHLLTTQEDLLEKYPLITMEVKKGRKKRTIITKDYSGDHLIKIAKKDPNVTFPEWLLEHEGYLFIIDAKKLLARPTEEFDPIVLYDFTYNQLLHRLIKRKNHANFKVGVVITRIDMVYHRLHLDAIERDNIHGYPIEEYLLSKKCQALHNTLKQDFSNNYKVFSSGMYTDENGNPCAHKRKDPPVYYNPLGTYGPTEILEWFF